MSQEVTFAAITIAVGAFSAIVTTLTSRLLDGGKNSLEKQKLAAELKKLNAETILLAGKGGQKDRRTFNIPEGWFLAGSRPEDYEIGVDQKVRYASNPTAYLKSLRSSDGFGTLMQTFSAKKYRGKRLSLTGFIKTKGVSEWAGLWMRVDGNREILAFDNMGDRPIRGDTSWKDYQVVLDVPDEAKQIAFGVLLTDTGHLWVSEFKFDEVDTSVATTGFDDISTGPLNLRFS